MLTGAPPDADGDQGVDEAQPSGSLSHLLFSRRGRPSTSLVLEDHAFEERADDQFLIGVEAGDSLIRRGRRVYLR